MDIRQLKQDALEELQEAINGEWYTDIDEAISEIADGQVPVYYSELLDVCYHSNDLDFVDEYNQPSVIKSIYDIISWNIYNELYNYLYEHRDELEEATDGRAID